MNHLRSGQVKTLLLVLLPFFLGAVAALSSFKGGKVLVPSAAVADPSLTTLVDWDAAGSDQSNAESCCDEKDIPGNIPPAHPASMAPTSAPRLFSPTVSANLPIVCLERFIPPQYPF